MCEKVVGLFQARPKKEQAEYAAARMPMMYIRLLGTTPTRPPGPTSIFTHDFIPTHLSFNPSLAELSVAALHSLHSLPGPMVHEIFSHFKSSVNKYPAKGQIRDRKLPREHSRALTFMPRMRVCGHDMFFDSMAISWHRN